MFNIKTTQGFRLFTFLIAFLFLWFTFSLSFPERTYAQSEKPQIKANPPELPKVKLSLEIA